ncbi:MAG TPA: excisionase family DNA-binding protein [Streptosporangiaceae bacterium]|jgi:excisionase family DNA binding protein
MSSAVSVIRPGEVDTHIAERAARRIRDYLASNPDEETINIDSELGGVDEALVVPRAAVVMIAQVLGMLADGQGVHIMPDRAMLTSQQAADMLNVSRPYLIGLLEKGSIPFTKVGTHRRVAFGDLLEYKRKDDQIRRKAAADLSALSEELGED